MKKKKNIKKTITDQYYAVFFQVSELAEEPLQFIE